MHKKCSIVLKSASVDHGREDDDNIVYFACTRLNSCLLLRPNPAIETAQDPLLVRTVLKITVLRLQGCDLARRPSRDNLLFNSDGQRVFSQSFIFYLANVDEID